MENSGKTILVVDDEDASRYTVSRYLRSAGFEVLEAKNGTEALELANRRPALIILDIGLPDMTGFEVCRQVKANPFTTSVPVLHTSASFISGQNKAAGLDGGADAYLTSPVAPEELVATVRSLIRMREAEAHAQALAQQWQMTFDAISDGICLIAPDGKIQRHNRSFAAIFGPADQCFVGESLARLLEKASPSQTPPPKMLQTRGREVFETKLGVQYLRVVVEPVTADGEYAAAAVCSLQDITVQKLAEEELRAAQDELRNHAAGLEGKVAERTSELKETVAALQSFYYSIAHDLQAPLRNIQSFTALLQDTYGKTYDQTGRDYSQRVTASAARMSELLKDLLAYGQVAHAKVAVKEIDLNQAAADALELLRGEIMRTGAEVTVEGAPWPKIWAANNLLSQTLVNILENALKFVKTGPPKIRLHGKTEGEYFRLWIEDNGIGIKPEHQERIFRIFERLHSTESVFSGTGMGLAIVRKAVERVGGQIGLESSPGFGSKFWLKFKLASVAVPVGPRIG
jgi:PAS domain S-box-containing protein